MGFSITLLLDKMETLEANPIEYFLVSEGEKLRVNQHLGKEVRIVHTGNLYCIHCGRKSSKLFGQGFCYPCFTTAPEAENCVLRPELCRAHEGVARDMEFAKNHCLIDHFVYFAAVDQIKVGVTRHTQIPTRWIDQGASSAIIIARVPNRYMAGCIEVELKKFFPDKTNWRAMLTNNELLCPNYSEAISRLSGMLSPQWYKYLVSDYTVKKLNYPVLQYPPKVQSIDLLNDSEVRGVLTGIKGQYLIFSGGKVINIRKHTGFEITLEVV